MFKKKKEQVFVMLLGGGNKLNIILKPEYATLTSCVKFVVVVVYGVTARTLLGKMDVIFV